MGLALNEYTELNKSVKQAIAHRYEIPHADVLKSYVDLLCLGKSDFEAVSGVREDEYFHTALGIGTVPSSETLRQRLDAHAQAFLSLVVEGSGDFLVNVGAQCTALDTGHVPQDADVTPFDNSQTNKEGMSRTYRGYDGYATMAAYVGREGYCLELELRVGKQHCQSGTPEFLKRNLERTRRVTEQPILLRLGTNRQGPVKWPP